MSFFTPVFRSRSFGHRFLTADIVVKVGLVTWLAPALVGLVLLGITVPLAPAMDFDSPWFLLTVLPATLLMSPIYGLLLVPLGLLIGGWAMRFGVAGWGMAALASFGLPLMIEGVRYLANPTGDDIGATLIFIPVVFLHAVMMWVATRFWCPRALLEEQVP